MKNDSTFKNCRELFSAVTDEIAEIGQGFGRDFNLDRKHPALTEIRAQIMIDIIGRLDRDRAIKRCDASACRNYGVPCTGFREQCAERNVEGAAELLQFIVSQCELIVLYLRQG